MTSQSYSSTSAERADRCSNPPRFAEGNEDVTEIDDRSVGSDFHRRSRP